MDLTEELRKLADEKYADFQGSLLPTLDRATVIGVRVPLLRRLAKEFAKTEDCSAFLSTLPHRYYEENLLHSILLEKEKEPERCLAALKEFLPHVDNWAVCDTLRPKVIGKNRAFFLPFVKEWVGSKETYTCRFGIDMLMTYWLDEGYTSDLSDLVASVESEEYYVRMMAAWYFATALSKRWEETIPYIENRKLPEWTHRKAIQKACESYRITEEQKNYLKTLK